MIEEHYSYVYRITHKVSGLHYYGARFRIMKTRFSYDALEDLKQYQSSSSNEFWKAHIEKHPEEFKFKIVRTFKDNYKMAKWKALNFEATLHEKFKVDVNDKFINKTNGIFINIDRYTTFNYTIVDKFGEILNITWKSLPDILLKYNIDEYNAEYVWKFIYNDSPTSKVILDGLFYKNIETYKEHTTILATVVDYMGTHIDISKQNIKEISLIYDISSTELYELINPSKNRLKIEYKLYRNEQEYIKWNTLYSFINDNKEKVEFKYKDIPNIALQNNMVPSALYNFVNRNDTILRTNSNIIYKDVNVYEYYNNIISLIDSNGILVNFKYMDKQNICELYKIIDISGLNAVINGKQKYVEHKLYKSYETYVEYNIKHTLFKLNEGVITEYNLTRIEMNKIDNVLYSKLFNSGVKVCKGYTLDTKYLR